MTQRLEVIKTYKLFIDGKFPRSESGRTVPIADAKGKVLAHVCRASRKDVRDAVAAVRRAQEGWQNATAYLRGQILYRMAEMLEGKKAEFIEILAGLPPAGARAGKKAGGRRAPSPTPAREVELTIDRLVSFAGWADKYSQVLGCNNPVAGPYYNFTIAEPTGVVAVIAPDHPGLLGLISLIAPALCAGNAVVALAGESNPIVAAVLGEVLATCDIPGGVVNVLTGLREELVPVIAAHRDVDAIHAAGVSPEHAKLLREGVAENIKRVTVRDDADWLAESHEAGSASSPWWIEPFVEMKTVWHPSGM